MFHHKSSAHGGQWVQVTGQVIDLQVLPGPRAPHPKLLTVELYPEGGAPQRAEIRLVPGSRRHWDADLYVVIGNIAGFVLDPASGEARFDMTDPRNHMSAHTAASDARAHAPDDDDEPIKADSGPPWLVLAACPHCRAQVNQERAAMEREPHCPACAQVLPAQPLVTSQPRRQSLS